MRASRSAAPGRRSRSCALALGVVLLLAGCGRDDPPRAKPAPPSPVAAPHAKPEPPVLPRRAAYEVLPVGDDWGAIEGSVRLSRALTPSKVRPTRGEDVPWKETDSDRLRFDAERLTLGQAIVFLRHIERGKDWPEAMRAEERVLTVTLRDGFLTPHVAWVRRGTSLELVNESAKMECNLRVFALPLVGMPRSHLVAHVMVSKGTRVGPSDDLRLRLAGPQLILPDI